MSTSAVSSQGSFHCVILVRGSFVGDLSCMIQTQSSWEGLPKVSQSPTFLYQRVKREGEEVASPHPDLSGAFFLPFAPVQRWHSSSAAVSGRLRAESSACVPDKWWLLVRGSASSWLLPLSWEACSAEQRAETPSPLPSFSSCPFCAPRRFPKS